jgi:hypothetical protein
LQRRDHELSNSDQPARFVPVARLLHLHNIPTSNLRG